MEWRPSRILETFRERPHFAHIFSDGKVTPTTIDFHGDSMTITSLPGEFPRFIRINRANYGVSVYSDQNEWIALEDEIGEDLRIFSIFDPVTVLKSVETQEEIKIGENGFLVHGLYRVERLELPPTVVQYFKEENQAERWTRLWIWHDRLIQMSQQDLPPFPDLITLVFSRFPGPIRSWPIVVGLSR